MRVAEAGNWFRPPDGFVQEGLFTFASVWEFLGIEPKLFLSQLEAISIRDLPSVHRQSARRSSLARHRRPRRSAIAKARKLVWLETVRPDFVVSRKEAADGRVSERNLPLQFELTRAPDYPSLYREDTCGSA